MIYLTKKITEKTEKMLQKINQIESFFVWLGAYSIQIYATHYYFEKVLTTQLNCSFINVVPLMVVLILVGMIICSITIYFAKMLSLIPYIGLLLYGKN